MNTTLWRAAVMPRLKDSYELILDTTVAADNEFTAPREIRWAASYPGGGKLLVSEYANNRWQIRNADLSFYSTFSNAGTIACDSDTSNVYSSYGVSAVRKHDINTFAVGLSVSFTSIRMIDASGDPDYVYVTSNNVADGHGIRMVKKSDMSVVASMLATGVGDSQFTNPLGLCYRSDQKKIYICEATRICVLDVDDTPGAEALAWSTSYAVAANDLTWDGTNWYVQSYTQTIKYDATFTDGTKVAAARVGYSICLIPNQGDGADGVAPTLAITDMTNHHLERIKTSDLSTINSVGSSGDGSASLFDPVITTSEATRVEWRFSDGQSQVTTGTTHALSKNGFAAVFFQEGGTHRCTVWVVGGLKKISALNAASDALKGSIGGLNKLSSLTSFVVNTNPLATGQLSDIPNRQKLVTVGIAGTSFTANPIVSEMPAIESIDVSGLGMSQAQVDAFLINISDAILANAAYFPAVALSLNIGGTNAAPSGVYQAASGDGGRAASGLEAVYMMANNAGHAWTVTVTGSGPYP